MLPKVTEYTCYLDTEFILLKLRDSYDTKLNGFHLLTKSTEFMLLKVTDPDRHAQCAVPLSSRII